MLNVNSLHLGIWVGMMVCLGSVIVADALKQRRKRRPDMRGRP